MHALPAPLRFDKPVVLLGGGWVDLPLLGELVNEGVPLIVADGGANCLADSDVRPDAIIGDLDSLADASRWRERTRLIQLSEQDTTDLEKCLYSVEAPAFIGIGFTGNRLDHTLSALHVLLRYAAEKPMVLAAEQDWVFVPRRDVDLVLPVGSRLSLFPLAPTRVRRSSGLRYPLNGLQLATGQQIGTSNEVVDSTVQIEFEPDASPACAVLLPRASCAVPEVLLNVL